MTLSATLTIIKGVEISCGCLESSYKNYIKLPPIEIVPNLGTFFDYDSKYLNGGANEICPPNSLSDDVSNLISEHAIKIHDLLGCNSYSRSDFIVDENDDIYYLETNTLPGMTQTSLLPQEADAIGITFNELIEIIINYKK